MSGMLWKTDRLLILAQLRLADVRASGGVAAAQVEEQAPFGEGRRFVMVGLPSVRRSTLHPVE